MTGSVKISQLPDGTLNLSELDLIPFVDHETMKTKRASLAALGQYIQDQQAAITSTDQLPEGFFNVYYTDARVETFVDSAYVQARVTFPESTDSSTVISIIDSDYINARVDHPEDLIADSSDVTSIIDSDYINARIDAQFLESTDSLSEGSINFYYTKSRFDSDLSLATTTDLAEGTNLYYTDARVENLVDSAYVQARQIIGGVNDGVYINENPPAAPIMGQQWLEIPDSGDAVLWIYDGSGWLESPSKIGPAGEDGVDGTSIDSDNFILLTIETVDSDYIQSRQIVGIDSATSIALTVETVDSAFLSNKISLDGLTDVTSPTPSSGEFLKYNGIQWVPSSLDIDAGIVFRGTINAVDSVAPATPKNGDMYINIESGLADASWAGLDIVDSDMQLLWESDQQSWFSIGGAGTPSGVQTIEEGIAILVDDTADAESPSISVDKNITDSWYYTQGRVDSMFASLSIDSSEVISIIEGHVDSAYVNALVDPVSTIDSEATISIIYDTVDSDYIKLIVETTDIIFDANGPPLGGDSGGPVDPDGGPEYGQVFGIDSATSIILTTQTVDSAYVQARQTSGGGSIASTDALPEGTSNLYYTDARADVRATLRINDATTDNIDEGSSNLYHTDARVESLVDSAYVRARQTTAAGGFDSASAIQAVTSADLDMDGNRVLFSNVYSQLADLPSASDNHGMFAHVHATGEAYYSHSGNWIQLAKQAAVAAGHDSALTQNQIDSALAGFTGGIDLDYVTTVGYNPADPTDETSIVLDARDILTTATYKGNVVDESANVIVDAENAIFSGTLYGTAAGNITTPTGSHTVISVGTDQTDGSLTIADITATGTVDFSSATVNGLPSAPVSSVNTKTGAVVLDAADVGALPSSTSYVASVNGLSGVILLDHTDVGAQVAGSYATASHNHSGVYQPEGNYALVGDCYTKAESNTNYQAKGSYATASHNHSGVYQPAGSYATATHNHSGVYQPVGNYALVGASYTKAESNTNYQAKGSYATASHNHTGVYQPVGNYPQSTTVNTFVTMNQSQYDALSSKDANTIYFIQE